MPDDVAVDQPIIQIEAYHDVNPDKPNAYQNYLARRAQLVNEVNEGRWATVVLDSVTSNAIAARKWDEYTLNPKARSKAGKDDSWAPFRAATNMLEDDLYRGMSGLICNVCLIAHVDSDKSDAGGVLVYNPNAPGRLATNLPAQFAEMYYAFALRGPDNSLQYALQTVNDGLHNATSQLWAPNPCAMDYEALWANWDQEREDLHCLVYGASGTRKSSFVATFPKPMLVLLFDGLGKAGPYVRQGIATKWQTVGDDGQPLPYAVRWVYAR